MATPAVAKKTIKALGQKRKLLLAEMKTLSAVSPKRPPLKHRIRKISNQISALKAAQDVARDPAALAKNIDKQEARVAKLKAAFKAAKGDAKVRTGKRLARAKRRLAEMKAAGKVRGVGGSIKRGAAKTGKYATTSHMGLPPLVPPPGTPYGAYGAYAGSEAVALAVEEDSPEADPELTPEQSVAVEEGWYEEEYDGNFDLDTLGEYVDDLRYGTGEWYKNPIVLTGAGVALFLVLRRR